MTIHEYIDRNLPHLNWNILPQIFEDNGVELTKEIEKYLRETPENTNWNVIDSMMNQGGGNTSEIWFVGGENYENNGQYFFMLQPTKEIYSFDKLALNPNDYTIILNGEKELFLVQSNETFTTWADSETQQEATVVFHIAFPENYYEGGIIYLDASIAPTSVEVSVSVKEK